MSEAEKRAAGGRALWREPAPVHFDSAIPWWVKLGVMLALLAGAFLIDEPVARWAAATEPLPTGGDKFRELMHLEQFGQWVSSVVVIAAVALLDRAGRRKALALALACGITALASHLLKDVVGRGRPNLFFLPGYQPHFEWARLGFLGWGEGFHEHYKFGSFPSAHTTGAFALATGLAWFYPRGRGLFLVLALGTAAQRVLHHEHFVSDTISGMILAVGIVRLVLGWNVPGRLIGAMPEGARKWWMAESGFSQPPSVFS